MSWFASYVVLSYRDSFSASSQFPMDIKKQQKQINNNNNNMALYGIFLFTQKLVILCKIGCDVILCCRSTSSITVKKKTLLNLYHNKFTLYIYQLSKTCFLLLHSYHLIIQLLLLIFRPIWYNSIILAL